MTFSTTNAGQNEQTLNLAREILMQLNITEVLNEVDEIVKRAIQEGVFPGATLWIGWHGETVKCSAYGRTANKRYGTYSPTLVTTKTLYDIASLTKIVATTCAIMHLVEQGFLRLTDPISKYISQFGTDQQKASVTIWHLLTHTSGLPGPFPLYKQYRGKDNILEEIYHQNLLFPPGTQQLYCDIGFILLGEVVHILSSMELSEYTHRYLFEPLGMKDTMFNPPETIWDRVAPTEYMEWRGGLVHGRVHDENAWAMGGVAGHAGLFSTIEDLAKFCTMLLGSGEYAGKRVLGVDSIIEMELPQSPDLSELFGLGWMINRPLFMGRLANNETFGHTGFTGTSIVVSSWQGLATVLLSNRVCPTRNGPDISPYRQRIADALSKLCRKTHSL
jgi:serine-type D-Ala-D-Ala carboxypeptidase